MPDAFVFLHIPKTGGMTFSQVVRRQFPHGGVVKLDGPTVESIAAQWRALPEDRRARVRCLEGHLPFGVDVLLGAPARYITFLRDPLERFTSAYHYFLRRPDVALHRPLIEKRMTLDDFAASPEGGEIHDAQTRMIAGAAQPGEPADDLARAKQHIVERFALVGIMERFDESTLLARALLGWRNVLYMKINQNKRKPPASRLPAATRALIEERSARDIELYRWGRARFAAALAAHPIAERELYGFQALNRCYGLARRTLGLPRALVADARAAAQRRAIARAAH